MSLPDPSSRQQANTEKTARFSGVVRAPEPPPGLTPFDPGDETFTYPKLLLRSVFRDSRKTVILAVFEHLHTTCRADRVFRHCSHQTAEEIAEATGFCSRAVEQAFEWLAAHGWIARVRGAVGNDRVMLTWCRWLMVKAQSEEQALPPGGPAGPRRMGRTGSSLGFALADPNGDAPGAARSGASHCGGAPPVDKFCALPETPGAKELVAQPVISSEFTSDPPPILTQGAYVNVISPSGELNTSTLAPPDRPAIENAGTGLEGLDEPALLAMLAKPDVYRNTLLYTGPLLELRRRGLPCPERYASKQPYTPRPAAAVEVKRYAAPAQPAKDAPPPTLEQKIRRLYKSGDLAEAERVGDEFFAAVREAPGRLISQRFHRRNLREVALGLMPPEVLIDAYKTFRAGTAENPRAALCAAIDQWREENDLKNSAKDDWRRRQKAARAAETPHLPSFAP